VGFTRALLPDSCIADTLAGLVEALDASGGRAAVGSTGKVAEHSETGVRDEAKEKAPVTKATLSSDVGGDEMTVEQLGVDNKVKNEEVLDEGEVGGVGILT
jgi:hypothetical protein